MNQEEIQFDYNWKSTYKSFTDLIGSDVPQKIIAEVTQYSGGGHDSLYDTESRNYGQIKWKWIVSRSEDNEGYYDCYNFNFKLPSRYDKFTRKYVDYLVVNKYIEIHFMY